MEKTTLLSAVLLALAPFTLAQTAASVTSFSPAATSSRAAATWTVSVGNNHQFQPDVVQALIGDTIEFDFMPKNHSVVRAEYKFPCIPYEKTGAGKVGFFAGFHPVDAILANPPKWTVRINDSDPIFVYCSAPGSCIGYGMVGVINPNASVSLATQKQMALDSKYMLQPGEDFPSESSKTSVTSSSTVTSTSTGASSTAASATTTSSPAPAPHKSGLQGGAIAGIVIGGIAVVGLAAALFFFIGRTKTLEESVNRQSQFPKTDAYPPGGPHGYYPVNPPDFQRHSHVSSQYDVPAYGSPNSQFPKPGQPGWVSPPTRGSASPPPPQPNLQPQPHSPQFYGGAPPPPGMPQMTEAGPQGGIAETAQRGPIIGVGEKSEGGPSLVHEMYAPVPKEGHEV